MNEKTRKSASQAGILIVLLLVLGFLGFRMFAATQGSRKPADKSAKATASAKADDKGAKDSGEKATATKMPPVPRTGDQAGKGMAIGEGDLQLNPNQFKVYALNPPKNP